MWTGSGVHHPIYVSVAGLGPEGEICDDEGGLLATIYQYTVPVALNIR